jgi:predicted RNase H-like HicB family nuclease
LLLTLIVGLPLRFIKKISKNLGAVPSTKENNIMKQFKVIVEKHLDSYVAYPLGFKGIIVGEGDTYEEALADVKSAIHFHIETFGQEVLEVESPILEAFVAEAGVAI